MKGKSTKEFTWVSQHLYSEFSGPFSSLVGCRRHSLYLVFLTKLQSGRSGKGMKSMFIRWVIRDLYLHACICWDILWRNYLLLFIVLSQVYKFILDQIFPQNLPLLQKFKPFFMNCWISRFLRSVIHCFIYLRGHPQATFHMSMANGYSRYGAPARGTTKLYRNCGVGWTLGNACICGGA